MIVTPIFTGVTINLQIYTTDLFSIMTPATFPFAGAGLGLRRDFLDEAINHAPDSNINFWEVAPENWMNIGGVFGKIPHFDRT